VAADEASEEHAIASLCQVPGEHLSDVGQLALFRRKNIRSYLEKAEVIDFDVFLTARMEIAINSS
jgi:hypothetical protein